jgi:hypothetical protein
VKELAFAFYIGGEMIDPAGIEDPEQSAAIQNIVESIAQRVGELECAEHGEGPRFVCSGENFSDLTLEVEGCCQALIEQVKVKLSD